MKRFALATTAAALIGVSSPLALAGPTSLDTVQTYDHHKDGHDGEMKKDEAKKDIVGTAQSAGMFNTLVQAVTAADLAATLQSEGPFTVLAPTDEAFSKLPPGTLEELLKPENKEKLQKILTYHVIPSKVKAKDALAAGSATTVEGSDVEFAKSGDGATVNGVNIVKTDISASNGVIHVIDAVLIPTE